MAVGDDHIVGMGQDVLMEIGEIIADNLTGHAEPFRVGKLRAIIHDNNVQVRNDSHLCQRQRDMSAAAEKQHWLF